MSFLKEEEDDPNDPDYEMSESPKGSCSESESSSSSDEDGDEQDHAPEQPDGNVDQKQHPLSRQVGGGYTLRALPDQTVTQKREFDLEDLKQEVLVLTAHAACIKGTLFLRLDRVLLNGEIVELMHFTQSATGSTTLGFRKLTVSLRGNYNREMKVIDHVFQSDTILKHLPPSVTSLRVSHERKGEEEKPHLAVSKDHGWTRPGLFTPLQARKWNVGEQKAMFIFIRRMWPTCRPSDAIQAPAGTVDGKEDPLDSKDDNEDTKREILRLSESYVRVWDAVRTSSEGTSSVKRWITSLFDSWRKHYVAVDRVNWEQSFREFWAVASQV